MSVPTQTRAVPFAGGPLNASILTLPAPLADEYTIGTPTHDGSRYVLAEDGSHYAWHVSDYPRANVIPTVERPAQVRPQAEDLTAQLRPAPLAAEPVAARPRRGSRRVQASPSSE